MKNVNIMGVHQFLGRGFTKKKLYEEFPKKGIGQFSGGLTKNRQEGAFEGPLIPRSTL